jgi:hypothetical protein
MAILFKDCVSYDLLASNDIASFGHCYISHSIPGYILQSSLDIEVDLLSTRTYGSGREASLVPVPGTRVPGTSREYGVGLGSTYR